MLKKFPFPELSITIGELSHEFNLFAMQILIIPFKVNQYL